MKVTILTVLYSAAIVQSLVLLIVLLRRGIPRKADNRTMLGLLLAILIIVSQYLLVVTGNRGTLPLLGPLATSSWFALGPLFYLFALSKSDTLFRPKKGQLIYFVFPAYNLVQYLLELTGVSFGFYAFFENYTIYSYAWLSAYLVHSLLFSVLSIKTLRLNRKNNKDLLWFFYLLTMVLVLSIVYLGITANGLYYYNSMERFLVVIFAAFVLMLTFRSLSQSRFLTEPNASAKYSNSGLSEKQLNEVHGKLVALMDSDQLYLDRKLSLAILSEKAGIGENQISQVFSQHLGSNFYDFISAYRLAEVEKRLADPQYTHLKIASLAADCGFNSKAAFYKAFKAKHDMTPTEYLASKKSK